jgi:hypothetical protein
MYPRIPWELVVDPLGSAEYTLGTIYMGDWRYSSTHFLTGHSMGWVVLGGSRPDRCIPEELSADTHRIGHWVGPIVSLHALEEDRLYLVLLPGMEPRLFESRVRPLFTIATVLSRLHFNKSEYFSKIYSHATFQDSNVLSPAPFYFYYLLKGPVADATDAPQPWRLIVQPCVMKTNFFCFSK